MWYYFKIKAAPLLSNKVLLYEFYNLQLIKNKNKKNCFCDFPKNPYIYMAVWCDIIKKLKQLFYSAISPILYMKFFQLTIAPDLKGV